MSELPDYPGDLKLEDIPKDAPEWLESLLRRTHSSFTSIQNALRQGLSLSSLGAVIKTAKFKHGVATSLAVPFNAKGCLVLGADMDEIVLAAKLWGTGTPGQVKVTIYFADTTITNASVTLALFPDGDVLGTVQPPATLPFAPTGAAGGDLTGTYPNPTFAVDRIRNTLTTTTGDIIYASSANTPARRAIGSTGDVLTVAGGLPTWATPAGASGAAGGDLTGTYPNPTVGAAKIDRSKMAAVGEQVSSSCGAFSTTSASYVDITNLAVTLTTTGRPIMVMMVPDVTPNVASMDVNVTSNDGFISFQRDGTTTLAEWKQRSVNGVNFSMSPFGPLFLDTGVTAATHTYRARAAVTAGVTFNIRNYVLIAHEL